ncbi:MAG: flagellar hook-length control protein FliK [Planctomycetota bacterium]|jgi:flagellar hook-length control protein FliK
MDANNMISLMNVITPEPSQVTADSDFMPDESSADFSLALEQAQLETQQTAPHDEPVENPSPLQQVQDEPVTETPLASDEQVTAPPDESSDNVTLEQPTNQVSQQGTQNTETQNERKALENTQHLPEKDNFEQMVDKIPHWSNSILLAHAGIERQAPPGKAQTSQQTVTNTENNVGELQTSEQQANIETNMETGIKLDASLIPETAGGNTTEDVASSNNSIPVELISTSTLTEQNQAQSAAQVMIDEEQTQQVPYQPQTISVSAEPKAPAQENQQITIDNSTTKINIDQPVSEHIPQNNQSPIQQSIEISQLDKTVNPQPVTEQLIADNKTDNSQNQTQQTTESNLTADSLAEKAESQQLKINNLQTSNPSANTNETNIDTSPQQIVNSGSEQNQEINSSTSTLNENPDTGLLLNTASAKVGQQIQESIQSSLGSDEKQITITLQPPELGKVTIKFEQQGGDITGQLEVTKAETRLQISQQLPGIIRNLADAGIQIKRIDVNLADQYEQEGFKQQSSQDMFAGNQETLGQQYDSQQQSDAAETSQQPVAPDQPYEIDSFDQLQMLDHEDSLDMLV